MPLTRISNAAISDIFLSEFLGEVANETAMLALVGGVGDYAVRTDLNGDTFIITQNDGSSIGDWQKISNTSVSLLKNNNLSDLNSVSTARSNLLPTYGSSGEILAVNSTGNDVEWIGVSGTGTVTSVAISGSDGIQIDSGSPITSSGTIALGIDSALLSTHLGLGSAATSNSTDFLLVSNNLSDLNNVSTARSNLLPTYGTSGYVLAVNSTGNDVEWVLPATGTGTVTSVAISGSDGIQIDSGSPITSSGTIALGIDSASLSSHLGLGSAAFINEGSGNGLDADTLDGYQASSLLKVSNNLSDLNNVSTARSNLLPTYSSSGYVLAINSTGNDVEWVLPATGGGSGTVTSVGIIGNDGIVVTNSPITSSGNITLDINATTLSAHLGLGSAAFINEGSGNGLDADTLDGQHGSYYQPASTAITSGNIGTQSVAFANNAGTLDGIDSSSFVRSDANDSISGVLTFNSIPAFNGGTSGSTAPFTVDSTNVVASLNADFLDGAHGHQFVRSDVTDTITGVLTFNSIPAFNGGTSGSTAPFTVDSTTVVANLNADTLDGFHASSLLKVSSNLSDLLNVSTARSNLLPTYGSSGQVLAVNSTGNDVEWVTVTSGSTNADTLDNLNSTQFLRSDATDTVSGVLFFDARPSFNGGSNGVSPPFNVDSNYVVSNLNADLLDGQHGSYYQPASTAITSGNIGTQSVAFATNAGTLDGIDSSSFVRSDANDSISGVLTFNSIPAFNGGTSGSTAPFTVDSTTVVANLNADTLDGFHATSLLRLTTGGQTITGQPTFSPSSGQPFLVTSSTMVNNLNADMLDSFHASAFVRASVNTNITGKLTFNTSPAITDGESIIFEDSATSYSTELQLTTANLTSNNIVQLDDASGIVQVRNSSDVLTDGSILSYDSTNKNFTKSYVSATSDGSFTDLTISGSGTSDITLSSQGASSLDFNSTYASGVIKHRGSPIISLGGVGTGVVSFPANYLVPERGIKFPSTQYSWTDANTLDDYEEGSFIPSVDNANVTYSTPGRFGQYVKIGRNVWINLTVIFTYSGSGTLWSITGLPFGAQANSNNNYPVTFALSSKTGGDTVSTTGYYSGLIVGTQINIYVRNWNGSGVSAVVPTSANLSMQGWYQSTS